MHDLLKNVEIAILRKAHERESRHGGAAHGVDIAQRIGGRDTPIRERVVDHGSEEVDRLHQRLVGMDTIHAGVILGLKADQQILMLLLRQSRKHLAESSRRKFAGATACLHLLG